MAVVPLLQNRIPEICPGMKASKAIGVAVQGRSLMCVAGIQVQLERTELGGEHHCDDHVTATTNQKQADRKPPGERNTSSRSSGAYEVEYDHTICESSWIRLHGVPAERHEAHPGGTTDPLFENPLLVARISTGPRDFTAPLFRPRAPHVKIHRALVRARLPGKNSGAVAHGNRARLVRGEQRHGVQVCV